MIELQGIDRIFTMGDQRIRALDQVSLKISAGDYLTLMGPSGSGKSTLLNILGLLDTPDAGRYLFAGKDVTGLDDDQRARLRSTHIGFVFQSFHLIPRMSAAQNIALPMVLAGVAPAERRKRVDDLLQRFSLADRGDHRPAELSGGQRQRVAIARAISMHPGLILADEPTGNLDQTSGHEVIEVLEALNREQIALLIVTHDESIGRRAPRQIRMVDGRIRDDTGNPAVASGAGSA